MEASQFMHGPGIALGARGQGIGTRLLDAFYALAEEPRNRTVIH